MVTRRLNRGEKMKSKYCTIKNSTYSYAYIHLLIDLRFIFKTGPCTYFCICINVGPRMHKTQGRGLARLPKGRH